ncbi:MAG: hypothetical protein ACLR3C_04065 [Eggerthella lenta]
MRVTEPAVGYLAQVMQLVSQAQRRESRAEVLSDKVARWLFYAAVSVGLVAFVAWLAVTGSVSDALTRMVTVFVIACPHARYGHSARGGALDLARRAQRPARAPPTRPRGGAAGDVVMMDKTGTLTEGDFRVAEVRAVGKRSAPAGDASDAPTSPAPPPTIARSRS